MIPLLTRQGCNAGACHGAAIGRGGFQLSLYGSDPQADYAALVQQVEGRRVNLARPEESLLLLKPTETIEHGGGTVIDLDGPSARILLDWIRQGARYTSYRKLARLELAPGRFLAEKTDQSLPLQAIAHYDDGTQQDVTAWTKLTAEDTSAVRIETDSIETDSAELTPLRRGRHIVVARFLDAVLPIEVIVPLTDHPVDLSGEPQENFIDAEILESLATLRLPVSPPADDATFLRRLTLDLTGRLPTCEQVEAFLADRSPSKRETRIRELLASDEFTEYWTFKLAQLLRIRPQPGDDQGAVTYHRWLSQQIRQGTGYDELARSAILASGDTHEVGPANFYVTVKGAREQAEFASELFMGSSLRCANCHNHPLDHWTQDDYHGLAAIFATIDGGRIVTPNPGGEVIHPRTLEPAVPRIPGQQFLEAKAGDSRHMLADWLTDPANPYFARAIVNRLWKSLMGRGLVEPVDDFRATNPPTHPELLDRLAADFIEHDYDLRHTLFVIASSATYARSARAIEQNKDDRQFYSHALRKPLAPEVLADAISDVLGVDEQYGDETAGTRAVALIDPGTASRSLDVLGRCGREESCESPAGSAGGLPQKLHLFNGPLLNARIGAAEGRLQRLIDAGRTPLEIIEEYYQVALTRPPRPQERDYLLRQLDPLESADQRRQFLEDFVWALLSTSEFTINH